MTNNYEVKKMDNNDIIGIIEAIKVCKMYSEEFAADLLTDVIVDYLREDPPEIIAEPMTVEHADIIGDAINICDSLGKYGTGDALFDVLNNHYTPKEDE